MVERARRQRGGVFDRRLAAIAAVVSVGLLAIARYFIDPGGPTGWSWHVLMLCVLVGAAAGRGLLGLRSAGEEEEARPSRGVAAGIWLVLLVAATLPNLHGLQIGFLADDFGLLRAARLADGPLDAVRVTPLRIFHRPVSQLLWWLGLHLWNGAPLGYHLLSVLLHALNTGLLYLLARRYTGSMYGAAAAALLFAVHVFHVEATVWAAAQPDLLCTAFGLASMWCLERHLTAPRGLPGYPALAGASAAFLLALWSKEAAIALSGVVLVRLALVPRDGRWARAARVGAAYAAAVGIYLAVRFLVLEEHWLGGYGVRLSFWNAAFLSTPLLLIGQFFFPVHRDLFGSALPPYLWLAAVAVMGAGLLWLIRGLEFVSWQRLVLYAGYLLVPAIPLSTAGLTVGPDMANGRYGYLPSMGLALLFGEVCARRRAGGRATGVAGAMTIVFAAVLSVWYVAPWRQAARMQDDLLRAGVEVVAELPDSPPPSAVFFQGVPQLHLGAPVFLEGGFAAALSSRLEGRVAVQEVAPTSPALRVMSALTLFPGEYLVSWDAESQGMVVERAGGPAVPAAVVGVSP